MKYKILNGFTYIEKLDEIHLSMFPDSLLLDKHPSSESILFRLLLGTVNLKQNKDEETFSQDICYNKIRENFTASGLQDLEETGTSKHVILEWTDNSFGLDDMERYFKLNRKNTNLFDELLTEFSSFFIYKWKGNNVSAFLHLYRALEYMSYSFPMTYSSRTSNFYTSFDTFKGFFLKNEDGQLKFFRAFVTALFDKSILDCKMKIDTYTGEEILDKNKKNIIHKLCSKFESFDDGYVLSIKYSNLLDLMINLRNRYFHFESGRKDNISNINFDSELFFFSLNDHFANWLSMIYLEVLTQGVYKHNLMPSN